MTRTPQQPRPRRHLDRPLTVELITLASIWSGLAILFAFTDLAISRALVPIDTESRFGVLIEYYGEIPGLLAIVVALFIVHTNHRRRHLALEVPFWILMLTLTSLVGYYASAVAYSRFVGSFDWFSEYGQWFWLGLAVMLFFLQLTVKNRRFSDAIHRYAKVTVGVAVLNVLLFVHIFKPLWGRVRFRDLDPGYSNFSPWYLPQGVPDASSFPSGHAALGWMLLPLVLLTGTRSPTARRLVLAGVALWGFGVSLGRVVAGAHYASDVLFSSGVALAAFALWKSRISPENDMRGLDANDSLARGTHQESTQ